VFNNFRSLIYRRKDNIEMHLKDLPLGNVKWLNYSRYGKKAG
jgi:hypothetical protein